MGGSMAKTIGAHRSPRSRLNCTARPLEQCWLIGVIDAIAIDAPFREVDPLATACIRKATGTGLLGAMLKMKKWAA